MMERGLRQGMSSDVILETQHLTKEFKGFVAVNDVNLKIKRGTIHALIGPNGAGKTTVFNLLTKFLPATSGSILYNGDDITAEKPAQIARRGIVRSFQISAVFPHLTVLENVRLGLQRKLGTSFHFWKSERSLDTLNGRAMELLESVDLGSFASTQTLELPYGRKRALEIATTLALEPDESFINPPSVGLLPSPSELGDHSIATVGFGASSRYNFVTMPKSIMATLQAMQGAPGETSIVTATGTPRG